MKKDWIKIENLQRFHNHFKHKEFHPDDPRHTPHWRQIKKNCIEGVWFEDFGKMRYGTGRLGFYGNYAVIEHTDEVEKTRRYMKPDVRDIEWERAYMYLEAEGFSGWTEDPQYTSFRDITKLKHPSKMSMKERKRFSSVITPQGTFKEYINPRTNIRMLHDRPKGTVHYLNPTKNIIELGSRGGGKSYWYALGGALYRIVFDGIKYYTEENRQNPPTVNVLIGSGRTDKSSEFCSKIRTAMAALATRRDLGAWGRVGDDDYQPSVFYKDMKGSLKPNNKDNAWRHEYEMNINGRWLDGFGTLSKVYHVNYSTQKKDGAEAGAGGRYTDVIYEEIGLTEKLIEAYNSNRATVSTGAVQFGVQVFLGTGGNMETIIPARKVMTHPHDYECLAFQDVYEGSDTPIGFFLPAYMTAGEFKDENGNTDLETAMEFYQDRRLKASQSRDPSVLRVERMNYPIVPSDMWQTNKGHLLPAREAEEREKVLAKNNTYQSLGVSIKLHFSPDNPSGVDYEVHHDAEPFFEFPLESNSMRKSLEGSIQIYDFPHTIRGKVPPDMYTFTHDPYVSDEWDKGGSLGVTHIWLNPKYWHTHMVTSPLVGTYIGKPAGGKKEYYENLEKLMAFYGNPTRGLWYEANRGEYCRGYFAKKKKTALLCLRPQYERGDRARVTVANQYGFMVGNKFAKVPMVDDLADFLLLDIEVDGANKKVIDTLPCIFSVRQIKLYDLEGNFDAVSSMMGFPLYMREEEHRIINAPKKGAIVNPLAFLSTNISMFGRSQQSINYERARQANLFTASAYDKAKEDYQTDLTYVLNEKL